MVWKTYKVDEEDDDTHFPCHEETTYDELDPTKLNPEYYILQENIVGARCSVDFSASGIDLYSQTWHKRDRRRPQNRSLYGSSLDGVWDGRRFIAHDCHGYKGSNVSHLAAEIRHDLMLQVTKLSLIVGVSGKLDLNQMDFEKLESWYPNGLVLKPVDSPYIINRTDWIRARPKLKFCAFVSGITDKYIEFSIVDACGELKVVAQTDDNTLDIWEEAHEEEELYFGKVYELEVDVRNYDGYIYRSCNLSRERRDKRFISCVFDPATNVRK